MNKAVAVSDALNGRHVPVAASQATSIEQSRAIAEVQAMVVVAQRMPRSQTRAISEIKESCGLTTLAERAFFAYPRGGEQITGATIQLATELARCWGNITYGVSELARNDEKGESEMLAFAWDVQTNVRPSTTFIVPHRRDTKKGVVQIVDVRDIYENNANNAARRLREMIFRALPSWLVADAQGWCRDTLEHGDLDIPLPKRIATMLDMYRAIGISRDRIEARVGKSADVLLPMDLASLKITLASLNRGEVNAEDQFPTAKAAILTETLKGATPPATTPKAPTEPEQKMLDAGDAAEAKTADRDKAENQERDLDAYLTGVIEDADLCDTIAALDALDADVKKTLGKSKSRMKVWEGHKTKTIDRIFKLTPK